MSATRQQTAASSGQQEVQADVVMKARKDLEADVKRARDLFQKLKGPKQPGEEIENPTAVVTGAEVLAADGLAFAFVAKGGVGVAFLTGSGFVIRKIPPVAEDDLVAKWSGPVFFNVRGASVGLTIGGAEIDSLIELDTQRAVEAFERSQMSFDTDLGLAAGKDKGTKLPGLPLMIPDASAGVDAYEFSLSKGALVDWSLRGAKISRDDDRIRRVYGRSGLLPADILAGRVPIPKEMEPLYDDLRQAAVDYAAALNAYAATIAAQAALTTAQAALMEPVE